VEILWWLAAPLSVTGVAVMWALARPVPARARRVTPQRPERPSGVAVRRSELTSAAQAAPVDPWASDS
jgi:hypothetical protein